MKCNKKSNFSKVCYPKGKEYEVEASSDDEYFLGSITSSVDAIEDWSASIEVGNKTLRFKLDTGADVTIIPTSAYTKSMGNLLPADKRLCGVEKSLLSLTGMATATFKTDSTPIEQQLYVVDGLEKPLLGRPAIEELGQLKRIRAVTTEDSLKTRYP